MRRCKQSHPTSKSPFSPAAIPFVFSLYNSSYNRLGKKWFHFKAIQSDFSLKWSKARVIAMLPTVTLALTSTFAYFASDNFRFHLSLFPLTIKVTFTSTFHFVQWRLAALSLPTSTWLMSRRLRFGKTHQKITTLNLPFCSFMITSAH